MIMMKFKDFIHGVIYNYIKKSLSFFIAYNYFKIFRVYRYYCYCDIHISLYVIFTNKFVSDVFIWLLFVNQYSYWWNKTDKMNIKKKKFQEKIYFIHSIKIKWQLEQVGSCHRKWFIFPKWGETRWFVTTILANVSIYSLNKKWMMHHACGIHL